MSSVGGRREGAGRKPAGYEHPEGRAEFEIERAEHERVKREQRELNLAIQRGEYLPREAQRQAAATALAVLTQALRSIPDNVERRLALAPEVVDDIAQEIDRALNEAAAAFRAMAGEA
jgi:phage terminase Nu1 subunit (DNA packaging protein)